MHLSYDPNAKLEFQYSVEPHRPEYKAAIDAMRHWSSAEDLATFALARHGYTNTNAYFGITYPTDLDESDLANGESIPKGYVEAMAGYGNPRAETHLIQEIEYIELLRQYLIIRELPALADKIAELKTKLPQEFSE